MKKCFTLVVMVLVCTIAIAQAPQKFTYQAVVRNASGQLLSNGSVGVRISVMQGSANGSVVYSETQTANTNVNGLFSIEVGAGIVQTGAFQSIAWMNGPYFLKSEMDPNGGTNYLLSTVQQLLSVPYALYANEAGNGFSGNYNDLTNTPVIPTVPTNVSAFQNDAGYITMQQVPAQPQGVTVGDLLYWNGSAWVVVPAGQQGQQLVMNNGLPTWQTVEQHSFYYITFNANGGNGSMNAQFFPVGISQNINTNMFTRSGYAFTGWNTAADGTGTAYDMNEVITLTNNITLYAQWATRVRVNLPAPCGQNGNNGNALGE